MSDAVKVKVGDIVDVYDHTIRLGLNPVVRESVVKVGTTNSGETFVVVRIPYGRLKTTRWTLVRTA